MNKLVPIQTRRRRRPRTPDMLSPEEERRLVLAWKDNGDVRARDRLIVAFAPMAAAIAKRLRPGPGEADPDLMQQANIGLMKALDRFDPDRETRFATYAVWWARAEVQAYLRANMSVVRRPESAQARRAAAQIARMEARMPGDPGTTNAEADERLADALGVDAERAAALRIQVRSSDRSLNVPALGDEGEEHIALLVDPASLEVPAPLRRLEAAGLRRLLVDALTHLPEREREIVVATQINDPPATLEALGAQYGVSKERIRQLRERGFERLRKSLGRQGLGPESVY